MDKVSVRTKAKVELQDITGKIKEIVESYKAKAAICHIFIPHTTAGVIINENADPSVAEDIAAQLETIVPEHRKYRHLEGNAPAHIKTSLVGNSQTLLIEDGRLVLGKWQGIFLCEFDGPRERKVLVKVMPVGGS